MILRTYETLIQNYVTKILSKTLSLPYQCFSAVNAPIRNLYLKKFTIVFQFASYVLMGSYYRICWVIVKKRKSVKKNL